MMCHKDSEPSCCAYCLFSGALGVLERLSECNTVAELAPGHGPVSPASIQPLVLLPTLAAASDREGVRSWCGAAGCPGENCGDCYSGPRPGLQGTARCACLWTCGNVCKEDKGIAGVSRPVTAEN